MGLEGRRLLSTFTVTNTADSGVGSLRSAVAQANANPGSNSIVFDRAAFRTPQTITLTSGPLEFTSKLGTETITGPTRGVTISGGGLGRVFQVDSGARASIAGLTITGGAAANGGGILNDGTLALTKCIVTGNRATVHGGGLQNDGTATLTNCTFTNDFASQDGGGVANENGSITLVRSTLRSNIAMFGGGLAVDGGTASLNGCTLSGNSASKGGGGVSNDSGAIALTRCVISGNIATNNAGGVFNFDGSAVLNRCTLNGNSATAYGGGMLNNGGGTVTLNDCTSTGNSAAFGGSVANFGTATLTRSTLAGNTAANQGGGLYQVVFQKKDPAAATLVRSTLRGNTAVIGGGISNQGLRLTISATTITRNRATSQGGGVFTSKATTGAGSTTIKNSILSANAVNSSGTGQGGGIDAENTALSLSNDRVTGNRVRGLTALGAGLYTVGSVVDLGNSVFSGNVPT